MFWAVTAIVVGNLVGGLFMAAHSAQGPILWAPQFLESRRQFGYYVGAWLPVVLSLFSALARGARVSGPASFAADGTEEA